MRYDNFPEETKWFVKDTAAGTNVYNWNKGRVTEAGKTIQIDMSNKLVEGKRYNLGFRDSFQGFCCSDIPASGPQPFARLTKIKNCVETILVDEDGKFGSKSNNGFNA